MQVSLNSINNLRICSGIINLLIQSDISSDDMADDIESGLSDLENLQEAILESILYLKPIIFLDNSCINEFIKDF